ncbi:hypothetical protein [Bacteroides sp. 14(A)]|uniref:hypothetical protein n=1 Tax=Bacteroides sp. 14(A) TaxID=1163670 RepID=UPI0018CC59B6|nr:hypothetical protein [Bacteroides sp. 14(A)]
MDENDVVLRHGGIILLQVPEITILPGCVSLNVNTVSNTITAVMYPDDEVPGGKNYPPEPLMILSHRGNPVNEDRQAYWYLSSREKVYLYARWSNENLYWKRE